ncbi:formate--tetrahydrofolate ligase [Fulvivirga kasyanovii]|uniref:Formate--tetrahydrofolate ligase n=1 Tax=Fulvivirga kasyanovii TaxID=396812 RepID=A0ABW9RKR9_9BACT|nr:formate--tetrahydrofolate ligase [Fulvivirga kasyanovii]MTI24556.1 formate--tetrahydrofolate ligase [Fulvivirga kasyanovii]
MSTSVKRKPGTDLEIAQSADLRHIRDIAASVGIPEDSLEMYGKYKAKLPLDLIDEEKVAQSNLVLVTAMTPTPAGEGKTTTSIGLTEGLNRIGKSTTVVLREPSLGPVFGMKGGAAGGGYSQVVPMEDINLHFTGDFAAIEKANNLLAAMIDNNIQNTKNNLGIDPRTVEWKRVMDMNDRSLRNIVTGMGGKAGGMMRETGFNITAASEIMAILCLAKDMDDLKAKIGNIYIGDTYGGEAVFARDIKAEGAMAVLLKDAIKPNLVQTLEGNPAILHGGPFANIAQGTNSVIATKMGMSLSDYVVTEAGFGADLGAEKFLNIKCGYSGLSPKTIVVVATIRALKYHGGHPLATLKEPDTVSLSKGLLNLEKHLENTKIYGVPAVVAINKFVSDTDEEINIVKERCEALGIRVALCEGWEHGGEGTKELAEQVVASVESFKGKYKPVYDWSWSVKEKIEAVARKIYGARDIEFLPKAKQNLKKIERIGLNDKPICIAKTQNSFSDDPKWLGRPENFTLTVREIEIAAGAGFCIPVTGNMLRMPGLPSMPAAEGMDIDNNGKITGLS